MKFLSDQFHTLLLIALVLAGGCTEGAHDEEDIGSLTEAVAVIDGTPRMTQQGHFTCYTRPTEPGDYTIETRDLGEPTPVQVEILTQRVWAIVPEAELDTIVSGSHFRGLVNCNWQSGSSCQQPTPGTPILEFTGNGSGYFDCGNIITETRVDNGTEIAKVYSFWDQAVVWLDAEVGAEDFMPLGANLACPGTDKATGIDPATGDVICGTDENTAYTAGSGVLLQGSEFSVDTAQVQARVASSCPVGYSIREIFANGTVNCEYDNDTGDITAVYTSSPLQGGCSSGSCSISVQTGGITGTHIQNGSITSSDIQDGSITSSDIANGVITGTDISSTTDISVNDIRATHNGSDSGSIYVVSSSGSFVISGSSSVNSDGLAGYIGTWWSGNGAPLVKGTTLNGHPDHGYVSVHHSQENDVLKAGMYVNSSHQGVVFNSGGTLFVEPHPDDPSSSIAYSCANGPEAGIYVRGTATLSNGVATVPLPEHFRLQASARNMTATLTPHSADSLGLARVSIDLDSGLVVRELHGGKGNYSFDYEIKAIRKGFEDYEVIRPTSEFQAASAQRVD